MYTRIVSFTVHPDHAEQISKTLHEQIIPTMQKQAGFVDYLVLHDTQTPERRMGISFWTSKAEADRYAREVYPRMIGLIAPYLKGTAEVHDYDVVTSTFHRIAAGKAA